MSKSAAATAVLSPAAIVTELVADLLKESRNVFVEIEVGCQNGTVSSVKDRVCDEIPAAFGSPPVEVAELLKQLDSLIDRAEKAHMFGTCKIQFAVMGNRLCGLRCSRERTHRK